MVNERRLARIVRAAARARVSSRTHFVATVLKPSVRASVAVVPLNIPH